MAHHFTSQLLTFLLISSLGKFNFNFNLIKTKIFDKVELEQYWRCKMTPSTYNKRIIKYNEVINGQFTAFWYHITAFDTVYQVVLSFRVRRMKMKRERDTFPLKECEWENPDCTARRKVLSSGTRDRTRKIVARLDDKDVKHRKRVGKIKGKNERERERCYYCQHLLPVMMMMISHLLSSYCLLRTTFCMFFIFSESWSLMVTDFCYNYFTYAYFALVKIAMTIN